jgi:hypothetical protein
LDLRSTKLAEILARMASIAITWEPPVPLTSGRAQNLIYTCDLGALPDVAGVYVFGRAHGGKFEPIYIGESENLQKRIGQHLQSVPLMMALQAARTGTRYVHIGVLQGKQGQNEKAALQRVESALIKAALAQGHELVNWKGTQTPYDEITFKGNRECTQVFGPAIRVERH